MTDCRSFILEVTMAIIVDKIQKRKDIALACKELFFQNGINDLTVSEVAKTAGVGKGTIYDYFENKEDIVFEIVNILIQERNIIKHQKLAQLHSTKDKIKFFAHFFYNDDDRELRQLYKEFISISLANPNEKMIDFQTTCFKNYYCWFQEIIQNGIDNGEIIPQSLQLAKGLFVFSEGMFIASATTKAIANLQEEIDNHIDALFELIEVKA
jgi:AcrR family transcriptional regulator